MIRGCCTKQRWVYHFHCILCLLWIAVYPIPSATAADYLYSVLTVEVSDPIIEFEAPPNNTQFNSLGEDVATRPDFLYSSQQGHRVVLYYLPWCPHCQAYVPSYIALARRVQEMIQSQENLKTEQVEFYAVSCMPNKQVCKDQHVGGIPGIKIFKAGSVDGVPVDPTQLHPFQIMRILGLPWGTTDDWSSESETRAFLKGRMVPQAQLKNKDNKYRKQDVFQDSYRSFHFTIENAIYTENGPLSEKSRKALADWLLLLQNTLPPAWTKIHELLQALVDNFESVTKEESKLQAIVANHPPHSDEWTGSCSHGKEGRGYTCGLWELFHIMTVGVVQFNDNAISTNEKTLYQYHTADVAQTLRDFLDHFFSCTVCRSEFLKSFDSCAYDRCHRLIDEVGEKQDWIELPLWLWQEHNSVNVRLMREQSQKEVTRGEKKAVQWPSHAVCPKCWGDGDSSSFDGNTTYKYLLDAYW